MGKEKSIYDLKLHETLNLGNVVILRVPGGWVYMIYVWQEPDEETNNELSSDEETDNESGSRGEDNNEFGSWNFDQVVFVPYDGEFKNGDEK